MSRLAALALLACAACSSQDVDPMQAQPRLTPYGAAAFFPRGPGMQPPPEGAVAREAPAGPQALLTGETDRMPLPLTGALLERGRHHFEVVCAACHGLLGDGRSPVARKMLLRPPPSLLELAEPARSDGQLYVAITQGYGLMPSFAGRLGVEDRWAVVAYLRALQLSQRAPAEALSAADLAALEGKP